MFVLTPVHNPGLRLRPTLVKPCPAEVRRHAGGSASRVSYLPPSVKHTSKTCTNTSHTSCVPFFHTNALTRIFVLQGWGCGQDGQPCASEIRARAHDRARGHACAGAAAGHTQKLPRRGGRVRPVLFFYYVCVPCFARTAALVVALFPSRMSPMVDAAIHMCTLCEGTNTRGKTHRAVRTCSSPSPSRHPTPVPKLPGRASTDRGAQRYARTCSPPPPPPPPPPLHPHPQLPERAERVSGASPVAALACQHVPSDQDRHAPPTHLDTQKCTCSPRTLSTSTPTAT